MRAEILSIGTELLLGTILDTNAQYLAQRLSGLGIDCFFISQVGDNQARLSDTLRRAWERSDLVIATGGIGPTQDDLTREAIAEVLGETPEIVPEIERRLRHFFSARGAPMPETNLKQATIIPSAQLLQNPVGTAPGWWVEQEHHGSSRIIVAMPGVPFEMRRMWEQEVEPRLRERTRSVLLSRTLKVLGLGESRVEQLVSDLMGGANPTLAPYAKQDGIHLRISAKASEESACYDLIAPLEAQVRERLGDAVYGADLDTPQGVASTLLEDLGLTFCILEVGEGAIGSASGLLGHLPFSRGCYGVRALGDLAPLTGSEELATLEEALAAVRLATRADLALAVQADVTPRGDDGTSVYARISTLLMGPEADANPGDWKTEQAQQTWPTSASEVRRLAGLAALNMLRLYLLEHGMVKSNV